MIKKGGPCLCKLHFKHRISNKCLSLRKNKVTMITSLRAISFCLPWAQHSHVFFFSPFYFFGRGDLRTKGQVSVKSKSTNSFSVHRRHPVKIKTRNLLFCICKTLLPKSAEGCWLNSFVPGGAACLWKHCGALHAVSSQQLCRDHKGWNILSILNISSKSHGNLLVC